jgi:hypothetical protein
LEVKLLSVKNVERVEMLESEKDVGCVETSCVFFESTDLREIKEKFTAWTVL